MILDGDDPDSVHRAAEALQMGGLVGLPTETVYGLAANAADDAAVAKIYVAKGRPAGHPLIVHVADAGDVAYFASEIPPFAQKLITAFWPGPLTLILPRKTGVATAAAGEQNSIGLRCPSHPVAQAVLQAARELGVPGLAAPSANPFGRVSPTLAEHVQDEFDATLGDTLLILDGGPCEVGIESTIVDCTRGVPVLLRPGEVTRAQIEAATGMSLQDKDAPAAPAPRASGTLDAHYAPRAKVRLMNAAALQAAIDGLAANVHVAVYARSPLHTGGLLHRFMPHDASAAAHELFAVLRELDEALGKEQAAEIWVETPPGLDAAPEWEGVADRLRRAAAA